MNLSLSKDNVLVPGVELSAIQVAVGKNTFIRREKNMNCMFESIIFQLGNKDFLARERQDSHQNK